MENLEFYATQELGKQYSINPDDIDMIYNGALDCCACGCEGTYTYPAELVEFQRYIDIFQRDSLKPITFHDFDDKLVFELPTTNNGRFGIRLYVKKKGEKCIK